MSDEAEPSDLPLIRDDEMDDVDYQVREVYAQYGLTNYFSQVMEKGVVNAIVLKKTSLVLAPSVEEWDGFFELYARLPLGQLLKSFVATFPGESEVNDALATALPLRNFVAHTFFWDRAGAFMSFGGRESMLRELMEAREVFRATDDRVEDLVRRVAAEAGIDAEQFDQNLEAARADLISRSDG